MTVKAVRIAPYKCSNLLTYLLTYLLTLLAAFRTAAEWGGSMQLSPHGVDLRKRRVARAERRARERDELQRKKDEDEKMQRTLKELEEQRQVSTFHAISLIFFCR